jgi:hypothetical protein
MFVRNAPGTVDFAQSNCQPEKESALLRRTAGAARAAPHDGDGKGDVLASGYCEFLNVEGL